MAVRKVNRNGVEMYFTCITEPGGWPNGNQVNAGTKTRHRQEIARFARDVNGDEVVFVSCSYRRLLAGLDAP